jgi:hypothetical protein
MPLVFGQQEKIRMMYVGFYNGMSYFNVDRVFDQKAGEVEARKLQECQDPDAIKDATVWCKCVYSDTFYFGGNYDARCRPWYMNAYKARNKNKVILSTPYLSFYSKDL